MWWCWDGLSCAFVGWKYFTSVTNSHFQGVKAMVGTAAGHLAALEASPSDAERPSRPSTVRRSARTLLQPVAFERAPPRVSSAHVFSRAVLRVSPFSPTVASQCMCSVAWPCFLQDLDGAAAASTAAIAYYKVRRIPLDNHHEVKD